MSKDQTVPGEASPPTKSPGRRRFLTRAGAAVAAAGLAPTLLGRADAASADTTTYWTQAQGQATQDQQTQLMAVAATIDELTASCFVQGVWINSAWVATTGSEHLRTFWVAPFDCKVVACEVMTDFLSIAQSSSNYMTFDLRRAGADRMVSKTTTEEAITARVGWNLDGSSWDPSLSQLSKDDGLQFGCEFAGTTKITYPIAITCRIVPT